MDVTSHSLLVGVFLGRNFEDVEIPLEQLVVG